MQSVLEINKLALDLFIGAEVLERSQLQEIECNISIYFSSIPKGCFSGKIDDTICYDELVKLIKDFCLNREFNLIEELCLVLFQLLKSKLPNKEDKLKLEIYKKPPINAVKGNCCFTISDLS